MTRFNASSRLIAVAENSLQSLHSSGQISLGVRKGLRNRTGLVVESGDPRTVHHLTCLVGYGAGAVNPYLAFESITYLVAGPDGADRGEAIDAYVGGLEDGLQKTMAKQIK